MTEHVARNNRKLLLLVVGWLAVNVQGYGQMLHATGARTSFEVASVKPSRPDEQDRGFVVQPGRFTARGTTVKRLILYAYGIVSDQEFSGGPKWMTTDRFDVVAKSDEAETVALSKLSQGDRDEQMRLMVQSLLAERLQLEVSFPKKELSIYALVVAKGGFKCMRSTATASRMATMPRPRFPLRSTAPPPPPPPPPSAGATTEERSIAQSVHLNLKGYPFVLWVFTLSTQPELGGRIVVDKTGLDGPYDCDVSWSQVGTDVPGPSFFTAIQEQMGLKLVPEKDTVETLVVESVERPSAN